MVEAVAMVVEIMLVKASELVGLAMVVVEISVRGVWICYGGMLGLFGWL